MTLVPIPLDALVGVYHPWADKFWGYIAGVPYKNIAVTDAFSQLFPWRSLAVDLIRHGQWPLWNPFSFAGYPLLANWQSAPFNPLNLLMLIFGNVIGYGMMVALQPMMAFAFMWLFLRKIKLSKTAAVVGGVSFALGGFMMTYLTSATTTFILAFIPLGLWLIEEFKTTKKIRYLVGLSLAVFCILIGGFFQPAFYALMIIGLYAVFSRVNLVKVGMFVLLGVGLASIQLLPTLELLRLSIRNLDHNIVEYHYGLLPIKQVVTLLAPDYFGNPATNNFFGFMQYQETSGYFGVAALMLALAAIVSKKKDWRRWLFCGILLGSLLLAFDNPLSRLVFQLKLPLLSTGYASRWLMPAAFAGAALAAFGVEEAKKKKVLIGISVVAILAVVFVTSRGQVISARNLYLPLLTAIAAVIIFMLPKKFGAVLIFLMVIFDMGRYTAKFTPYTRSDYGTTEIKFLADLRNKAGINRVAIDQGPLMPANTWMYPRLYSLTGYDPLLYKDYEVWFRALNIGSNPNQKIDGSLADGAMTRYLNLDNPMSPLLDLAGAKYLLTLKKDKDGRYNEGGKINQELLKKYQLADEYGATVLLENRTVLSRFKLYFAAEGEVNDAKAAEKLIAGFDFGRKIILKEDQPENFPEDKSALAELVKYEANEVVIRAKTKTGGYLFLSDTDYPGWRVSVNGKEGKIIRADGIFRAVALPPGDVQVRFWYMPKSFETGLRLTEGSIIGLAVIAFIFKKKKS